MTQVKEMSNTELNCALAELINYPLERLVPNYCTDPAASLEVQTAAIKANESLYLDTLNEVVNKGAAVVKWGYHTVATMLTATPRERAEAAYLTLGGE